MKIDAKSTLLCLLIWAIALHAAAGPGPREALNRYDAAVVVIDPGHGGTDEGAKGPSGALEKDLMLELARKIKARLVPDLEVRFTRNDDYQVALADRTAVANSNQAALLVSLHTGASFTSRPDHTTIYLYASPPEPPSIEPPAMTSTSAELPRPEWQWQHQQGRHLKESQRLGATLASQLKNLAVDANLITQNARLPILAGADLPAVLLEFGDLSSAASEERLSSAEWQQKVAGAVADALRLFISTADH